MIAFAWSRMGGYEMPPHRVANVSEIMVMTEPVSTNAVVGTPLTSILIMGVDVAKLVVSVIIAINRGYSRG